MAQKQQAPRKKAGSLGDIYTGPDSTHPGILKAKANKAKADSAVAAYAKKAAEQKKSAIEKAKKKQ